MNGRYVVAVVAWVMTAGAARAMELTCVDLFKFSDGGFNFASRYDEKSERWTLEVSENTFRGTEEIAKATDGTFAPQKEVFGSAVLAGKGIKVEVWPEARLVRPQGNRPPHVSYYSVVEFQQDGKVRRYPATCVPEGLTLDTESVRALRPNGERK